LQKGLIKDKFVVKLCFIKKEEGVLTSVSEALITKKEKKKNIKIILKTTFFISIVFIFDLK
jgi:hypothetical protein